MKKAAILLIILTTIIFSASKRYTREYTYYASEYDSKVTARTNALEQVKILLLEELSKFIQSQEKLTYEDGKEVYHEDINSYVAGIAETHILDEKWTGSTYWVKADIVVDPDDVMKKLKDVINNKELSEQLREEKARTDNLMAENERLRKQLQSMKNSQEKEILTQKYTSGAQKLAATDWFDKAYYASTDRQKIEYYTEAIRLDPNYKSAYYNRGISYYDLEQFANAISDYTKALDLDPNYSSAWYNRSLCYYVTQKYQKALSDCNKALAIETQFANAYKNRANIHYMLGNYAKAISDYTKTESLNNADIDTYFYRGSCYKNSEQYTLAIPDFTKVLQMNQNHKTAYFNRAYCYDESANLSKAISDYTQAILLDPSYTSAIYNRGTIYYKQQLYAQAIADFNNLISIDPYYSFGYYYLGLIYQYQGYYQQAITQFNNYLRYETNQANASWVQQARENIYSMGGTPVHSAL